MVLPRGRARDPPSFPLSDALLVLRDVISKEITLIHQAYTSGVIIDSRLDRFDSNSNLYIVYRVGKNTKSRSDAVRH